MEALSDLQKGGASAFADGGSFIYLGAVNAAAQTTIEFTSLPATYDEFVLVLVDLWASISNRPLNIEASVNNGASYISSGYFYSMVIGGATVTGAGSASANSGRVLSNMITSDGGGHSGEVRIFTGDAASFRYTGLASAQGNVSTNISGGGVATGGTKVNAVRFSGEPNLTGKVMIYGVKNS